MTRLPRGLVCSTAALLALAAPAHADPSGFEAAASGPFAFGGPGAFAAGPGTAPLPRTDFEYTLASPLPFSAYVGAGAAPADLETATALDGAKLELGLYAGLKGRHSPTGLGWDMGFIYRPHSVDVPGHDYDAVEVQGALRYDFGGAAVTASLNYAPDNLTPGRSAYVPMLAAEVPIGDVFTLAAHVARPWTASEASLRAPDSTGWNVSGTLDLLGFGVTLSYSENDLAGTMQTPGRRATFTMKRSF